MEEPNTVEIVDKAISTSVAEEPNVNLENSAKSGDGEDACLPGNEDSVNAELALEAEPAVTATSTQDDNDEDNIEGTLWNVVEHSSFSDEKRNLSDACSEPKVSSENDDLERLAVEYQQILDESLDKDVSETVVTTEHTEYIADNAEVADLNASEKGIVNANIDDVNDDVSKLPEDDNNSEPPAAASLNVSGIDAESRISETETAKDSGTDLKRDEIYISDVEDALDKDVRRILAKYGRRLSSSSSDAGSVVGATRRISPVGSDIEAGPSSQFKPIASLPVSIGRDSDYSSDNDAASLTDRVSKLLTGSSSRSANTIESSTDSHKPASSVPSYLIDDPEKSMSLSIATETVSDLELTAKEASHRSFHAPSSDDSSADDEELSKPLVDVAVDITDEDLLIPQQPIKIKSDSDESDSDDSDLNKTEDLLDEAMATVQPAAEHVQVLQPLVAEPRTGNSSSRSSQVSSIDYQHLERELEGISEGLKQLKEIRLDEGAVAMKPAPAQNVRSFGSTYSTVNKDSYTYGQRTRDDIVKSKPTVLSSDLKTTNQRAAGFTQPSKYSSEYIASNDTEQWGTPPKKRSETSAERKVITASMSDKEHDSLTEDNQHLSTQGQQQSSSMSSPVVKSLLTSKVVPLDVALDMVHGSRSTVDSGLRASAATNQPFATSARGNYADTYVPSYSAARHVEMANDRLASIDKQDRYDYATSILRKYGIIPSQPDQDPSFQRLNDRAARSYSPTSEHIADSEVGDELETATQDTGEVSLTERLQQILERNSPTRQAYTYLREAGSGRTSHYTDPVVFSDDHRTPGTSFAGNLSFLSPFKHQGPLQATSRLQHFMSSQLDRAAAAKFDTTLSPMKGNLVEDEVDESVTPRSADGDARMGNRRLHVADRPGEYYVGETVQDDCAMSETTEGTTVESTHPGSDDAKGPYFPSHVYGSRADVPSSAVGIYSKPKETKLADIHEQSGEDKSASKGSSGSEKSRRLEDKERSLRNTEEWLNGSYPGERREGGGNKRAVVDVHAKRVVVDVDAVSDQLSQSRLDVDSQLPADGLLSPSVTPLKPDFSGARFVKQQMTSTPAADSNFDSRSPSPKRIGTATPPLAKQLPLSSNKSPLLFSQPLDLRLARQVDPIIVGVSQQQNALPSKASLATGDAGKLPSRYYFADGSVVDRTNTEAEQQPPAAALTSGYLSRRLRSPDRSQTVTQASTAAPASSSAAATHTSSPPRTAAEAGSSERTRSPSPDDGKNSKLKRLMNLFMEEMPDTDLPSNLNDIWLKYQAMQQRFARTSKTGQRESVADSLQHLADTARAIGSGHIAGRQFDDYSSVNETPRDEHVLSPSNNRHAADVETTGREDTTDVTSDAPVFGVASSDSRVGGADHEHSADVVASPGEVDTDQSRETIVGVGDASVSVSSPHTADRANATASKNSSVANDEHLERGDGLVTREVGGLVAGDERDSKSQGSKKRKKKDAPPPADKPVAGKPPTGNGKSSAGRSHDNDSHNKRQDEGHGSKTADSSKAAAKGAVKTAWIVKDETLHSIPEDNTLDSISSDFTNSSVDSDGRVVVRTTKRHLPDDPRLLKLQEKLHRQKEHYYRNCSREQQRKQRIELLKLMVLKLRAKKGTVNVTTSSSSDTFTFSEVSSSTLTQSELEQLPVGNTVRVSKDSARVDDSSCSCVDNVSRHDEVLSKRLFVSENSPERNGSKVKKGHEKDGRHLTSETRQSPSRSPVRFGTYTHSNDRSPDADQRRSRSAKTRNSATQTLVHFDVSWSSNNEDRSPCRKDVYDADTYHDKHTESSDALFVRVSPHRAHRDTDMPPCPRDAFVSVPLSKSPAKQPSRYEDWENIPPKKRSGKKSGHSVPRGKKGEAWYIAMDGEFTQPEVIPIARQPLHETQQPRVVETGYRHVSPTRMTESKKTRPPPTVVDSVSDVHTEFYFTRNRMMENKLNMKTNTPSLREVFEACRPDFITRSRERLKLIALKAEERSLQAMLDEERRKLFQINRKKETDPVAHPYSEKLHVPQRRSISKREMKEITERKYHKLPEVTRKVKDAKLKEEAQRNRLRAQLYKEKVRQQVLCRQRVPLHMP